MYYKNCKNFVGDEDCGKCLVYGYIMRCPYDCPVPDIPPSERKMEKDGYVCPVHFDCGRRMEQEDKMSGTLWVSFDGKDCSGCKHLNDRGYCEYTDCIIPCTLSATVPMCKPQTNADRIRAMTDEELMVFLELTVPRPWCATPCRQGDVCTAKCERCVLDWLKQEIKE